MLQCGQALPVRALNLLLLRRNTPKHVSVAVVRAITPTASRATSWGQHTNKGRSTVKNKFKSLAFSSCVILGLALGGVQQAARATDSDDSILKGFKTIKVLGSTVPAIGDVNPYGMAEVKYSVGRLHSGHILISNFNNASNLQGTGTTIVEMSPNGAQTVFATLSATSLPGSCPGGVGLTTALVVLNQGWVIVGSLPTSDGTSAT